MQLLEDGSWITQRAGWSIQIIGEDNKCIESCSPEHKTLCFSRVVSKVIDTKFKKKLRKGQDIWLHLARVVTCGCFDWSKCNLTMVVFSCNYKVEEDVEVGNSAD